MDNPDRDKPTHGQIDPEREDDRRRLEKNYRDKRVLAALIVLGIFVLVVLMFLVVLLGPMGGAAAAPDKGAPAGIWTRHAPDSELRVDHAPLAAFVDRYAAQGDDGVVRVAYGCVTEADRAALDGYLATLAAVPVPDLDRPTQRAYWINLYNALTLQTVLAHHPVDGIRDIDISPGLFADGPWGAELVTVAGRPLSLDDIEHRILRPIWDDPRLHYALNCAAVGCPDLRAPYTAGNAEQLLDAAARDYVRHPRGARIDDDGALRVSSIFDWYEADFGGSEAAVIAHLRRHAGPDLAAALAGRSDIDAYAYDWALNDRPCDPAAYR